MSEEPNVYLYKREPDGSWKPIAVLGDDTVEALAKMEAATSRGLTLQWTGEKDENGGLIMAPTLNIDPIK